ncbi:FixJ family two-component response regulator [Skermanella aerolata]|uniref:response regulator transcription factor n=1 Tax=Skermanella aerolata TaxID=393310 RepID=UPI003D26372E
MSGYHVYSFFMEAKSSLVAIIDDDPGVCRALARVVRSLGFDAAIYLSGEEFLEQRVAAAPNQVLLDLHLPGLRGAELISALLQRNIAARIVVMTGLDLPGVREECLDAGAVAYITKPVHRSDLAKLLNL